MNRTFINSINNARVLEIFFRKWVLKERTIDYSATVSYTIFSLDKPL